MSAAGGALALLRIQSRATFMEHYTTVVGRRIYLPYEPGASDEPERLWREVATAVHEHQHIVQARRDGFPRFAALYLASPMARARYEAEAYGCDMEIGHWAGVGARSVQAVMDALGQYGLSDAALVEARSMLEEHAEAVAGGEIRNEATHVAIEWLETRR